jgi:hypothetical protein
MESDFVPDAVTIEMKDTNEITLPFEWSMMDGFGSRFMQITLVDDRIVIHEPTAADATYTKPCKVDDNSYIRTFGLFSIKVPQKFFDKLGIKNGNKIDMALEENCVSIRKNTDAVPEIIEPEPPEPKLAFCCVCGGFRYTGQGLAKVLSKYIAIPFYSSL